MRRLTLGALAIATLALALAVPASASHGGDAHPAGVDIVPDNAVGDTSAGTFDSASERAFVRMALFDTSLTQALYVVLLYDRDGDLIPIGGQIMRGDGTNAALEFAGPSGEGIDVSRAQDELIYACALTIYRGRIRDTAGYDSRGRCTTAAGAMELAGDGTTPGGGGWH
jgi:hypothetical protein